MEDDGSRAVAGFESHPHSDLSHVFVGHASNTSAARVPAEYNEEANNSESTVYGAVQTKEQPLPETTTPSVVRSVSEIIVQEQTSTPQLHEHGPEQEQELVSERHDDGSMETPADYPAGFMNEALERDTPAHLGATGISYIEDVPVEFLSDQEDQMITASSPVNASNQLLRYGSQERAMEELDSWAVRNDAGPEAEEDYRDEFEVEMSGRTQDNAYDAEQTTAQYSYSALLPTITTDSTYVAQDEPGRSDEAQSREHQSLSSPQPMDSAFGNDLGWLRSEAEPAIEGADTTWLNNEDVAKADRKEEENVIRGSNKAAFVLSANMEDSSRSWLDEGAAETAHSPGDDGFEKFAQDQALTDFDSATPADDSWLQADIRDSDTHHVTNDTITYDGGPMFGESDDTIEEADSNWLGDDAGSEQYGQRSKSPTGSEINQSAVETTALRKDPPSEWLDDVEIIREPSRTSIKNDTTDEQSQWEKELQADGDSKADKVAQDDLEDSWAAALATNEPAVAASWDTAFEDIFEEDGFLDEPLPATDRNTSVIAGSGASPYAPQPSTFAPLPSTAQSAYVAPYTSHPVPLARSEISSAPKDFFAELPVVNVPRSRKALHQPGPILAPSGPPGPGQARPGPPGRTPTMLTQTPPVSHFRPPERLELFPQEEIEAPAVLPHQPSQPFVAPLPPSGPPTSHYTPSQPQPSPPSMRIGTAPPTITSRYSPAPMAPTAAGLGLGLANGAVAAQPFPRPPSAAYTPSANQPPPGPSRMQSHAPSMSALTSLKSPPQPIVPASNGMSMTQSLQNSAPEPPPANRYAPRTSSPLAPPGHRPHLDRSVTMPMPPPSGQPSTFTRVPSGTVLSRMRAPVLSRSETYSNPRVETTAPSRPKSQDPETSRPARDARYTSGARLATIQHQFLETDLAASPQSVFATHIHEKDADDANFLRPVDEQSTDVLQRWKESPIFRWGSNGMLITSFPQRVPRYGGGQAAPLIKCVPGDVRQRKALEFLPHVELLTTFPGPLKSKGKKKEVISWLTARITKLQEELNSSESVPNRGAFDSLRTEERLLLWQGVRSLVEHDGYGTDNTAFISSIRQVLTDGSKTERTNLDHTAKSDVQEEIANGQSNLADVSTKIQPTGLPTDVTDSSPMDAIKSSLVAGDRDKAVWTAVDHRLWGHAMLIASTSSNDTWKQVVQEFVRKEVRTTQLENQPLAALYEVFAGNWDESIDALVPPSARAGFQMVSAIEGRDASQNVLDGLNQWRETLGLILSNRSKEDERAILALGKLLASYGRIEAAHFCYLLARSVSTFGGADDELSVFSILGMDTANPKAIDLDGILLTEVYEFALSLAGTGTMQAVPHLQAYKLYHAYSLSEVGKRTEALDYCATIASILKSTTRPSPYYHPTLVSQTDDLSKRLSQTPKDASTSWLKPPSMEKVSTKFGKMFESFVAGGDSDKVTNNGGDVDVGPFSRVSAGTPTISRTTSSVDLYGSSPSNYPPLATSNSGNSRYAPGYLSRSSQDSERPSLANYNQPSQYNFQEVKQRNAEHQVHNDMAAPVYGFQASPPSMQIATPPTRYQPLESSPQQLFEQRPHSLPKAPYNAYAPTISDDAQLPQRSATTGPISETVPFSHTPISTYVPAGQSSLSSGFTAARSEISTPTEGPSFGYEPSVAAYEPPNSYYEPQTPIQETSNMSYESPSSGYEPPAASYDPSAGVLDPSATTYEPSTTGYEPPSSSYQPYEPASPVALAEDENSKKKKKSFMDDDDDDGFATRSAEVKKQDKGKRDKEVDEKVKKAAEADGEFNRSILHPHIFVRVILTTRSSQLRATAKSPEVGSPAAGSAATKRTRTCRLCTRPSSATKAPSSSTRRPRNGSTARPARRHPPLRHPRRRRRRLRQRHPRGTQVALPCRRL